MDSRLVRIFCANSPSQQARGASYNLLLLLRKDCLFCHRSECYGPPSPSISLESIKSLFLNQMSTICGICAGRVTTGKGCPLCSRRPRNWRSGWSRQANTGLSGGGKGSSGPSSASGPSPSICLCNRRRFHRSRDST